MHIFLRVKKRVNEGNCELEEIFIVHREEIMREMRAVEKEEKNDNNWHTECKKEEIKR